MANTLIMTLLSGMAALLISGADPASAQQSNVPEEFMKGSLVYLKTSYYGYDQAQPWKHDALSEKWACGCAVGPYQVLTTARSAANLAFVKALRYGQNEFVNAQIKLVDYRSNLCLIELDPNELSEPLKPLQFSEAFEKKAEVDFYWLSSENFLYNGRGFLDRASVEKTPNFPSKRLHYIVTNTSQRTEAGQVYCVGARPIGIACWSNDSKDVGLIPGAIINAFLKAASEEQYKGLGEIGFAGTDLPDPAMRSFLKMPASLKSGMYVADVYTLGTGSDVLKPSDVILGIDGNSLNPYGQYKHPQYDRLSFEHLITSKTAGDTITFELWRNGGKMIIEAAVKNYKASDMLIPYHEYDIQPEYAIIGGFVLQKLTRAYLAEWGDNWSGKVSPHLYHYYRDLSYKPTADRRDVVILSYVLPARINVGYNDFSQMVVETINGMTIRSMADVVTAQKLSPESAFHIIDFELDTPTVVIPRNQLAEANAFIAQNYGIRQLFNVNP